jgi:hypothetical protein
MTKNKGTGRTMVAVVTLLALLIAAGQAMAFEKVSNCELREYGVRIGYIIGPRVPVIVPLKKATSEAVFSDFFKAMAKTEDIDFLEKYAHKEDVEKTKEEYRNTLIGHLEVRSELINNLFYGGQWIRPQRLSCEVCYSDECRVLHADIRMSTTMIVHPEAE